MLRRTQLSPHFSRVTFGRGDIGRFTPRGYDQWVRLLLPASQSSLDHAPRRLGLIGRIRYRTVPRPERPVIRSFAVRAFRPHGPEGPEIDIDFVTRSESERAGPATRFALTCSPGDEVGIIDQGTGFDPPYGIDSFLFVTEESGLPALEAVVGSLPSGATGTALVEVPSPAEQRELTSPQGLEVTWLVREYGATPGALALRTTVDAPLPSRATYAWVAGERALATGVRRHLLRNGLPKERIVFSGYWRDGHAAG